ncbi:MULTISPECIES: aconitate hydratase AcnA [unclassified Achromobacter]|uniref:aconitate hydratase AcnA n=1 Tax=unclassified Achromobacter TaxID=2626865 RepID=UPI0018E95DEE|nr:MULTISPECIES: aconitate hydratase AcnA [unclassified Achromobacter]
MNNSFGTLRALTADLHYYSLPVLGETLHVDLRRMPVSLKVLLENLLRHEDGVIVTREDILSLARWPEGDALGRELSFHPARVLMPDSSGVPLLIDLASMRDAMVARGLDPQRVDPVVPTQLVIDHSVRVDRSGSPDAFAYNLKAELERNRERYGVVRWAMSQFRNLRVVPPGNGIVHQVNIEYFAQVVSTAERDGVILAFPDSLVGMDSHTPMVNGMGVFGWGVGGIEAATAMFGQPVGLQTPRIVGCRLNGAPRPGVMCTDIVLALTRFLREADVLAAVVEFCGPALDHLTLPDRATIANMAAEYGATMGFFPIDDETLRYLRQTGRTPQHIKCVELYARAQGLWRDQPPDFQTLLEFDLSTVAPALAGPSRPEALVPLCDVGQRFRATYSERGTAEAAAPPGGSRQRPLRHGDIVIASIASCTNTANPHQVIAAGLLARNAVQRGLSMPGWIKTSFSPGSRAVSAMLDKAGLSPALDTLGFNVVGFGCMACGSNSGVLAAEVSAEINAGKLVMAGIISSNRNFDGRLNPAVRGTFLGSPPLVVAYALAGSILCDITRDPLGEGKDGRPVFLADIWPGDDEIHEVLTHSLTQDLFRDAYDTFADPGPEWHDIPYGKAPVFAWDERSMFLRAPPFLDLPGDSTAPIEGARMLLMVGDDLTTDHISPGSLVPPDSDAGVYLAEHGVAPERFGTYISRRANHEVMVRGTFANPRLRNEMEPDKEGGYTRHQPAGEAMSIFHAAQRYAAEGVPLVVVAGSNYGCGSSRDWAAKGTRLLGVRAVLAESFERIHRSNLVGMGVLPLEFPPGVTRLTLGLTGAERFDIPNIAGALHPGTKVDVRITYADGRAATLSLTSRVDTQREADWVGHGGVLPYVLNQLVAA